MARYTPACDDNLARAVSHFARHGCNASTRGLAQETGITQPLLYRYLPVKDGRSITGARQLANSKLNLGMSLHTKVQFR